MLRHKFIELRPPKLEEGVLYISVEYCSAIHKCACGCGNEVVTPLSPTGWQLTFDGRSVSLYPSIGNWNFDCKSHYWITKNEIHHADTWTEKQIHLGRTKDRELKDRFYNESMQSEAVTEAEETKSASGFVERTTLWKRILKLLSW